MVFQINDELTFPDPHYGEPDGLLAVGGDLSVDRLLLAYSNGIFPWYSFRDNEEILWFCPMKRFVIFPSEIHVSHSMHTLLRKETYEYSINMAFSDVIRLCSEVDGRHQQKGAWLGEDMIKAYTQLHQMRFAASVEVWEDGRLVGGLYGVNLGRAFFGESMFSLVPNGSKLALIYLAYYLHDHGGSIIDCQFETPHLRSMGGRYISYDEYMRILHDDQPAL